MLVEIMTIIGRLLAFLYGLLLHVRGDCTKVHVGPLLSPISGMNNNFIDYFCCMFWVINVNFAPSVYI